jgi:hypothetical protein
MIIENEFKEFQHIAEEIDRQLYFTNLVIRKIPKGETPRNESGVIYIDETDDSDYFAGELVHEASHSVFDPVTVLNYVDCAYAIAKELDVELDKAQLLANVASDIIVAYEGSKNRILNEYRRRGLNKLIKSDPRFKAMSRNPLARELLGIYKELHGIEVQFGSKLWPDIKRILEARKERKEKYVEIARLVYRLLVSRTRPSARESDEDVKKRVEQKMKGAKALASNPIFVSGKDFEKLKGEIMRRSGSFIEAKQKLQLLKLLSPGGVGEDIDDSPCVTERDVKHLVEFYEEKANQYIMAIDYPEIESLESTRVGSRLWRPNNGFNEIDIKRTMYRFGVNIPLATTQTPRTLNKGLSNRPSQKPIDLVVSIDCSGSTGEAVGSMSQPCDFEITTTYAIINLAKRINQNIGLTLWSDYIDYTTLPDTLSWREVDRLKEEMIRWWKGGNTIIWRALEQARQYKDKLFFVFTDGAVFEHHLIDVENVVFFLVMPKPKDYKMFIDKYGEDRVVKIDSLEDIPTITLKVYKSMFKVG